MSVKRGPVFFRRIFMRRQNSNCAQAYASIVLVGPELSPEAVSRWVNLKADFQAAVGETKPARTSPRVEAIWSISSEGHVDSTNLEDHIEWLLDLMPDGLRSMLPPSTRCEISCFWISASGHGGPDISSMILSRLARFGFDLTFDFYSNA